MPLFSNKESNGFRNRYTLLKIIILLFHTATVRPTRSMCLLSISLLKIVPFLAGFPSTRTHYNTVCGLVEKPATRGLVSWFIRCLPHLDSKKYSHTKHHFSYYFRHRTPFRPKSNSIQSQNTIKYILKLHTKFCWFTVSTWVSRNQCTLWATGSCCSQPWFTTADWLALIWVQVGSAGLCRLVQPYILHYVNRLPNLHDPLDPTCIQASVN